MSIENIGTSAVAEGIVLQVDTITISSVTPAALSKVGITSYPAFEAQGATPTADVIKVFDVTTSNNLVLNTDYILTPSGAGPTLTYTVTRISTSVASADGNSCRVTYNYGTIPGYAAPENPLSADGITGTAPTGTAQNAAQTDTTGTAVAGIGAALPGGSTTDPAALASHAGSEMGAPGSEYTVSPVEPSQYGWPLGSPDTNPIYGGGLPSAFSPVLGVSSSQGLLGSTADPAIIDTTIGGGAVHVDGTPPVYRSPIAGIAASSKDTSLTDILGNQINANPTTTTAPNVISSVDTQYFGAPATPTALLTQTDTIASIANATNYYLSQLGVIPSSLVVTTPTGGNVAVAGADYLVTTTGNGPTTAEFITTNTATIRTIPALGTTINLATITDASNSFTQADVGRVIANADITVGTRILSVQSAGAATMTANATATGSLAATITTKMIVGNTATMAYSYGDATYWDSNVPATPPAAPTIGATVSHTDTITINASPAAFSTAGVVTPPGSVVVVDQTGGNAGKTLVLNVDYTLTITGSGATTAYTITRLGTSPNSALNDSTHVTYSTGNTAYFTSGPVRAVNRGILVPFDPSNATSPVVDYYWVQSSTLGTQWVPASGQAMFSGQPSGAGAMVGQPTYQADTFTGAFNSGSPNTLSKAGITTPREQIVVRDTTSSALTIPTSGYISGGQADPLQPTGSVLIYGVDYTVTATGVGPYVTYQVQRVASSVNSANGDTIIVEYFYDAMGTSNLTAVSDAVTLVAGSVTLNHTGIVLPPQSLIVYDTTISKSLAFGLDYTVTSIGTGPTANYTINVITTGPAGAGLTNALNVIYLYGVVLGTVFTQGMYENTPVIYKPDGTVYGFQGYRFAVAAGNRAGLSAYSAYSDYVVPLNYNAPQPGFQGTINTITGVDPVNTINPVYRPDGTIKAGTGLGG